MPYMSSIEVGKVETMDIGPVNGTQLPEEDMPFIMKTRGPEIHVDADSDLHQQSTLEDANQPPILPAPQSIEPHPIEEEHADHPQQMAGKIHKYRKCLFTNKFCL